LLLLLVVVRNMRRHSAAKPIQGRKDDPLSHLPTAIPRGPSREGDHLCWS